VKIVLYLDVGLRQEFKSGHLKYLENIPNLEIITYHFEKFFDKEKKMHRGLFGTTVRMVPLFEFKYKNVIILDIDLDTAVKNFIIRRLGDFLKD
jgi:hypothetical protein